MKKELWTSDQPVLSDDLERAQSSKEEAIVDRFNDSFDYGIIEGSQILGETSPLKITLSLSPFQFSVATGVAYDSAGDRIRVDDPTVVYNASAPTTATDNGIGGTTITPQSTGCKDVPLTASVVNYIYITYLQRIDPAVFTLRETTNERLFVKGDDSYRIDVVTDIGPAVGDPNLFKPFSTSLCIGTVDINQVLDVSIRKFFTLKSNSLSIDVPTALNTLSSLGRPYLMGQSVTFSDHVAAIGSGVVSATNPHGLSINDITGVFSGKTAEQHEKLFHESGISGDQTSTVSGLYGAPEDSAGSPFIGPTFARDTFLIKKLLPSGTQNFNGNGTQQLFTLTGGLTFIPSSGNLRVYLNGVLQLSPSEYTEVGNNAINFVTPPALGLPIALVVDGEAAQVNGTTVTSSQISEDYNIYFVDSAGTFLDNGVYTVYLDASIGAIRLAYNGSPTNKNYRVYGVTTGTFTNLVALPIASVSINKNNLLLWEVIWDSSGFDRGPDNFILVTDKRVFGTIGNNSLARDSATDTITINHNVYIDTQSGGPFVGNPANLGVKGDLSIDGSFYVGNNLTVTSVAYFAKLLGNGVLNNLQISSTASSLAISVDSISVQGVLIENVSLPSVTLGSPAASTWYRVFILTNNLGSSYAGLITTNTTPSVGELGSYTKYRRVGWIRTDGSSNFRIINQVDQEVFYLDAGADFGVSSGTTSFATYAPATSRFLYCYAYTSAQTGGSGPIDVYLGARPAGASGAYAVIVYGSNYTGSSSFCRASGGSAAKILMSSSQSVDFSGSASFNVMGYIDPV